MKTETSSSKDLELNEQQAFKLIDGTFDAAESADVLFSVLSDKIRFHNIQILSIQERFSGDTSYSEKRLDELKAAKRQVAALILKAKNNNCDIEIKSSIQMTLKKKT
ncbi:hypothetical protein ACFSQP_06110 [Bizionia sediminis]|uniref:Uncharacterized protein n=1 Tax=Bizionia sediminis TaxID=1737064 RepID=A0ABW5KQT6_9FLAO